MSEIGAALGIAKSTAQKYLVEMNARGMLSYHAGEIVTEKIQKVDTSITSMGILGSVSCGTPDLAEEFVEQYVSFPTALFGKGEFFILRANGESMIGAGIDDGDLVVVRKQLLASGVPSHILSGITDHFLSENWEPINEFSDCQQPRLANCLFLRCHRLNSLNLASLH